MLVFLASGKCFIENKEVCYPWRSILAAVAAVGPCWQEHIEWQHAHADIERPINTSGVRQTLRSPVSSRWLSCRIVTQPAASNYLL